jgi:hypothetical protein
VFWGDDAVDDDGDGGPSEEVDTKAWELLEEVEKDALCKGGGENGGVDIAGSDAVFPASISGRTVGIVLVSTARIVGEDTRGVEGALGRSLEKRLAGGTVLTLMPAFFNARMRSAMLPPEATLRPLSSSSASAARL